MDFCDYFGYGFTTIKPNGLYIGVQHRFQHFFT